MKKTKPRKKTSRDLAILGRDDEDEDDDLDAPEKEEGGHWKDQAEHELKLDSDMASAMAWRAYLAAARRGGGGMEGGETLGHRGMIYRR